MARTNLPVNPVNHLALTLDAAPVAGDVVNNMIMINDGMTYISLVSTSGATQTVTVTLPGGVDVNLVAGPRTYSVPANGKGRTGFFPTGLYGSQLLFSVTSALVTFTAYTFAA